MKNEMTRFHFVDALVKEVYSGSKALLLKAVKEFVQRNNVIVKDTSPQGFLYDNELYGVYVIGFKTPRLDSTLEEEFLKTLQMFDPSRDENMGSIKHFFVSILNNTTSIPELVALFPAPLHQIITQYQDILTTERLKPDSWVELRHASSERVREIILQKLCMNLLIVS